MRTDDCRLCGNLRRGCLFYADYLYAILKDDLEQKSLALIDMLEKTPSSAYQAYLDDFARENGADVVVWDNRGTVLYTGTDTVPYLISDALISNTAGVAVETAGNGQSIVEDTAVQFCEDTHDNVTETLSVQPVEYTYIADNSASEASSVTGNQFDFVFADGVSAMISITGGFREVNQAMEALGRLLPFLIIAILLISLLASFFYARFITRPIVTASNIAGRMASLDFDARWTKPRKDEIGMLGESLNRLSDNLSFTLQELETANLALQGDIERERELERQRLAFFSAASHELKTPITILKGQLSGMLAQVGIYADREKYLARALAVTDRMEGLVKEIVTISRIESGNFALKSKPVDMYALVQKQIALDAELFAQKNISVETRLHPEVIVAGDARLLTKVLDNVFLNAVLYSPSGASVRIVLNQESFSIENTGVSIPEDSLAQLFTPFYRVEQSRNRKSGGSGLGLFLVKTILNLHAFPCVMENTADGVRFSMGFQTNGNFSR